MSPHVKAGKNPEDGRDLHYVRCSALQQMYTVAHTVVCQSTRIHTCPELRFGVGGVGTITRTPCSAAFNARGTDKKIQECGRDAD